MKLLRGIVCNSCKITIKPTHNMNNEDWIKLQESSLHLCTKCEEEFGNSLRLDELEKSRHYLNSDYYWKRIKELGHLSNEQIDIMKFNENQTT